MLKTKLDVIYQDQDLLILNKPPGLLCVPGLSEPLNLFDMARAYSPNARVVHRLDMATSGIVIFALNHSAQKHLGRQFEQRHVKKRYTATVDGYVKQQCGEIVAPLICDWERRPKQKIDWLDGKPSHTIFKVIRADTNSNTTRLSLSPVTGRSHQLRLHCCFIGHPILGDKLYHSQNESRYDRMFLHAEAIEFAHPSTGQPVKLESPAPF